MSLTLESLRRRAELITARRQEAYDAYLQYTGGLELLTVLIDEAEKAKDTKDVKEDVKEGAPNA